MPGTAERLLPGLKVPRIFLYAPYFEAGDGLVGLAEMPVDVAEYYFHALIDGALDREIRRQESSLRCRFEERAEALMAEVPPQQRLEVYLGAAGDFASHLLSIAHEILRAEARAEAAGKDICALLDPPRALFGLWQQSIGPAPYPGRYRAPQDPQSGAAGQWLTTARGLEPGDKELLLVELFGGAWSGEPQRDFGYLCRQAPSPPTPLPP